MANNFTKKTGIVSKLTKFILNYGDQISSLAEKYGYGKQVVHSTTQRSIEHTQWAVCTSPAFASKY